MPPVIRREPPRLYTIYENPEKFQHKIMYEDLIRQLDASETKLARKQGNLSKAQADLYQILGLFFVFQGVVITAVSQTSTLGCENWYLPFILSLLVSVATVAAATQKLHEARESSEQCRLEKVLYGALYNVVDRLRDEGGDVPVEECVPLLPSSYATNRPNFFRRWVWTYAGAVLALILLFSALTFVSVRRLLCDVHKEEAH